MKLDTKDYKILYELDLNSRQPINRLAKKIRLNKDTVLYRIKRLEEENIILRYQAYINHGKLGYISARLNIKLQNTTPEKEKEIIEFVKKQEIVGFFASCEGNVDLVIWILTKSINKLHEFWNELLNKYANYIEKTEMGIYTKIIHYPRSFLINKENTKEMIFTSIDKEEKIDKTDIELLKILTKNARSNITTIAQKLNITTKTASVRIKNLEKRGIIQGYTALFNIEKLGYLYYKIYFDLQNTSEEILKKLNKFISIHQNIIYSDYVIGGHACEIEVQVKNEIEIRKLIDQMKSEFSQVIRSYEILYYFKEHKMLSMPWAE